MAKIKHTKPVKKGGKPTLKVARKAILTKSGVASGGGVAGIKKPYRHRPGKRAEIEIRQLQKSTKPIIPKTRMDAVVREIIFEFFEEARLKPVALDAIQAVTEDVANRIFVKAWRLALQSGLKTIKQWHLREAAISVLKFDLPPPILAGQKVLGIGHSSKARRKIHYQKVHREPAREATVDESDATSGGGDE